MTAQDYKAPESVSRVEKRALVIGVLGLVGCIIGWNIQKDVFIRSYLVAFLAVLGLSLGSLGLLMLQHLTGGHWGIMIRRPLEAASRVLWLVAGFFIPLWLFNRLSAQQDANKEDRNLRARIKFFAGPGIILYVFAMTFAAIDWVMSLSPHWASTIYGFMFVAGQAISAMALMILVIVMLSETEPFSHFIQERHLHDLGKLLFAFNMLWAYFSFSQLLIIWSGNQPEEITFYHQRLPSSCLSLFCSRTT